MFAPENRILEALERQRLALIKHFPKLKHSFVPIKLATGGTLPFLPIREFRDTFICSNVKLISEGATAQNGARVFMSSGSTGKKRAEHIFSREALSQYAHQATIGFKTFLSRAGLQEDTPILSLIPSEREWPTSSLAAMIEMFRSQNLNITHFNIESKVTDFLTTLEALNTPECVIFGTSVHHVLLAKHKAHFRGRTLAVIDTGGTKGRTRSFTESEIQRLVRETYTGDFKLLHLSEYGMCELGSQAYSAHSPHDGTFMCNETLFPVVCDLDTLKECPVGTKGFLAFVDTLNVDSYGAIITEDLAIATQDTREFKLAGRAPDATLKGCSLNVKDNYIFGTAPSASQDHHIVRPQNKNLGTVQNLLDSLNAHTVWDRFALADLAKSLQDWDAPLGQPKTRQNERALIVTSANIPITWLYPVRVLCEMGVKAIDIQLPSLRADDPLASRIREQSLTLLNLVASVFPATEFALTETLRLGTKYDLCLVFGSDQTVSTFEKIAPFKVIGFGDVKNALYADNITHKEIADLCAAWFGRGCLTPVTLITENHSDPSFAKTLAKELDHRFVERYEAAGVDPRYFHRSDLLHLRSRLAAQDQSKEALITGKASFVVDLRGVKDVSDFDFAIGGMGLVFVMTREQFEANQIHFKKYKCAPQLRDAHCGKTWMEWLKS